MTTVATIGSWIAATVLILAGAAKVSRPGATADALRDAGLPHGPGRARVLGAVEVVCGGAVLAVGGVGPAAALTVLYGAFVAHNARELRRGRRSCGCFGDDSAPLSGVHLWTSAAGVSAGALALTIPTNGLSAALAATGPVEAALAVGLVALAATLIRIGLTDAERVRGLVAQSHTESA